MILQPKDSGISICIRAATVVLCVFGTAQAASTPSHLQATSYNGTAYILSSKRGTGWGFNASGVANELTVLPVSWWYNWGNYNPDPVSADFSQVIPHLSIRACLSAMPTPTN
jgi:hypothetical protein